MSIFKKPLLKSFKKRSEIPEGLWRKCPTCSEVLHSLELEKNYGICRFCDHHFSLTSKNRIDLLIDENSFEEQLPNEGTEDILNFPSYKDRINKYQKKTGLKEAVKCGIGKMNGIPLVIAVMDFRFLAASMGVTVGEKITHSIEYATNNELPILIVSSSGGARMYEGLLSLMQMAKTSAALGRHSQANLPFISLLTHPTTGGVSASFATLGDIIIAEPKAMIGFAGPRVIKETTHQELPEGFQTADFLLKHGHIDAIVPRKELKEKITTILSYLCANI